MPIDPDDAAILQRIADGEEPDATRERLSLLMQDGLIELVNDEYRLTEPPAITCFDHGWEAL